MQVKNVMKRSVEVVAPDTLLHERARKMSVHNISVLPVCEGAGESWVFDRAGSYCAGDG